MSRHALVKDGAILEYRDAAPNVDQATLHPSKPRLLPVVVDRPDYDPQTQVMTGPAYEVEAARVVERYTARTKNEDEAALLIAAKDAEIEAEFNRRKSAPIAFEVEGKLYDFHADQGAVENIMGLAILAGQGIAQNPRNWTPLGSADPVENVNVVLLGAVIAARRDALFIVKKAKQKALAAMTDPAEIAAIDPAAGWE